MQIYRCAINRTIDKNGSIRCYIGYIRQKRLSDNDSNYDWDNLVCNTDNAQDIILPKNPEHNKLYCLNIIDNKYVMSEYYE